MSAPSTDQAAAPAPADDSAGAADTVHGSDAKHGPDALDPLDGATLYRRFADDWKLCFTVNGKPLAIAPDPVHLFACFRQLRRAFHHIFDNIVGNSMPIAHLRASVWQSAFSHDLRRYFREAH